MNITLTVQDFAALSPFLIVLLFALLMLGVESWSEKVASKCGVFLTSVGLLATLAAVYYAPVSHSPLLTPWLVFDDISKFFAVLFVFAGLASALLASAFFKKFAATQGEFYFLLLSAVFGLLLVGYSAAFLTLFLGIETLSIALYILCGYIKRWGFAQESAIKYFLTGAISAAILLYGIALLYGAVGSTRFSDLLPAYQQLAGGQKILFLAGIAFITAGLAFKAALVPFHAWAPDVYDGSPTPVTAFMAVGTKAGAFAAFVRVFMNFMPQFDPSWSYIIAGISIVTLLVANILGLRQMYLRRFFAYSGISHAGFLLMPLVAGNQEALQALNYYLVVYSLATIGAFAVLTHVDHNSDGPLLTDLRGLFKKSPLLAGLMAICLLTLAGTPPTAGFFAKLYIFKVAYQAGYLPLVIVGLFTTILSAYYYLQIAAAMFTDSSEEHPLPSSWAASLVGLVVFIGILYLSIYPGPLLNQIGF